MFNFRLTPLSEVSPWGKPDRPSLHWYGLSYGEQWIDVGSNRLFEISEEFIAEFGGARYMDYDLTRLYEDLLEMLPHVLEPVPDDLSKYLQGAAYSDWQTARSLFYSNSTNDLSADDEYEIDHTMWISSRSFFFHNSPHPRRFECGQQMTD